MTHPEDYRVFYWAPDMSFCGFAANNVFQRSGLTNKHKEFEGLPPIQKEAKKSTASVIYD
jgi:hypothetical protein